MVWLEEHFLGLKKMAFGSFPELAQLLGKCRGSLTLVVCWLLPWKIKTQGIYTFRKLKCFMGTVIKSKQRQVSGQYLQEAIYLDNRRPRGNFTVFKYLKDCHVARGPAWFAVATGRQQGQW